MIPGIFSKFEFNIKPLTSNSMGIRILDTTLLHCAVECFHYYTRGKKSHVCEPRRSEILVRKSRYLQQMSYRQE